jgi:hypothetical protein
MSTQRRIIMLARQGFTAAEIMEDCYVGITEVTNAVRAARKDGRLPPDFKLPPDRPKPVFVPRQVPPGAAGGGRRRLAARLS